MGLIARVKTHPSSWLYQPTREASREVRTVKKTGFYSGLAVFLLFSICLSSQARASGFGVFTQGASALGQAAAVTAHTDGPSTIFYNPALLNDLQGTRVEIGTTLFAFNREFKSAFDGDNHGMKDDLKFPSTLYLSHTFSDKLAAGVGIFFPFGLATDWKDDWEGRFIATQSEMTTYTINPVISYRLHPRISVAAGLDFVFFDAELSRRIDLAPLGFAGIEGSQKFKGDDTGIGFNLGLSVQLTDRARLGVSYRSEVKLRIDGDAKSSGIPESVAGLFPDTGGEADLTLPQQLSFGLAYQLTDALIVEAGARWEDWSVFDELRTRLDQPVVGQSEEVTDRRWNDTWAFNLGAKYRLNENLALLAGYLYGNNPVPSSTFDPSIPDSDTHLFTLGADMDFGKTRVSLSYGYQIQENRRKNNIIGTGPGLGGLTEPGGANGSYKTEAHLFALSIGYQFQ